MKGGVKTQLFKLSEEKGPDIEVVRDYVCQLLAGKKVVGHNLTAKMTDFGLNEMKGRRKTWTECVEIAKVFNWAGDES